MDTATTVSVTQREPQLLGQTVVTQVVSPFRVPLAPANDAIEPKRRGVVIRVPGCRGGGSELVLLAPASLSSGAG